MLHFRIVSTTPQHEQLGDNCPICFSPIAENENGKYIGHEAPGNAEQIIHLFHERCIKEWILSRPNVRAVDCPMCRAFCDATPTLTLKERVVRHLYPSVECVLHSSMTEMITSFAVGVISQGPRYYSLQCSYLQSATEDPDAHPSIPCTLYDISLLCLGFVAILNTFRAGMNGLMEEVENMENAAQGAN